MLDALGNEITIGALYGYSQRSNGHVKVRVGRVIRISDKSVSLELVAAGSSVYEHPIKNEDKTMRPSSVVGNSIFPIDPNIPISWAE